MARRAAERIDRSKAAVIEIAIQLFVARGFETVGMDEIAKLSRVPARSLFRYFVTKEDIVLAAVNRSEGLLLRSRLASGDGPREPITRLEWAYLELAASADRMGKERRDRMALIFRTPVLLRRIIEGMDLLQEQLTELTTGTADPDPDVVFGARVRMAALSAAYVIAARKWIADDSRPLVTWATMAFNSLRSAPAAEVPTARGCGAGSRPATNLRARVRTSGASIATGATRT